MEFAKPESGQYKTIGIGMRAKKGGDFKAWGFCLKDGSRIGDGFELYSNVGSQFIPHDHKTLKNFLEMTIYLLKKSLRESMQNIS